MLKRTFQTAMAAAVMLACGSHGAESNGTKPAEECVAYAGELRSCLTKIGATRSTDQLVASAMAPRDEATRGQMNSDCARSRALLRTTCK